MSGFVGIVNFDGSDLDGRLLRGMTESMAYRGPHGVETWSAAGVGLGHTLLKTADDGSDAKQPFTLDETTWIVGDARIDARAELMTELAAAGEVVTKGAPDVELVLRAYRVWEQDSVAHLLGDFAFAIWDARRGRLFCGRDQLGVKSLFYARCGRTVVVSNTIDCLRRYPGVSDRLNDLAVSDFLLFELNQDPATTVFADIERVPPAHTGVWSALGSAVMRYWALPVDEPTFYRRAGDYIDRFHEVIGAAVSDRIRTDRVGIFMSGGIDSPALASVASRVFRGRGRGNGVRAFTTTIEGVDRREGHYARLVAEHLGIPISIEEGGPAAFDPDWSAKAIHSASPIRDVGTLASDRRAYLEMSRHAPVAFYGEGPDNALQYEWQAYLRFLRRERRYARLAGDIARHVKSHRRLPLQSLLARLVRARRRRGAWDVSFPQWLNPAMERRLGLRDRWERFQYLQPAPVTHPVRPAAYASFCGPEWEALFRGFDAEETGAPLDVRHPYVDLRVLRYLLSVPAVPWCRSKHLIRRAMRDSLPQAVLTRPKSGLVHDWDYQVAAELGLPRLNPHPLLRAYVDPARVPDVPGSGMIAFRADFRPRALNFWLSNLPVTPLQAGEENAHDVVHA